MHLYLILQVLTLLTLYLNSVIALPQGPAYGPAAPSVTIASGALIGTAVSTPDAIAPVDKFLGIPFAASPPERFGPPKEPSPWTEPLNVTAFKPVCIQQYNYPESARSQMISLFDNPPLEESEDCLYLNVWAPSGPASDSGRAVMFWIHGGAYLFSGTSVPIYDGTNLAAIQDVVVVSTAYRLNVFGFPAAPELHLEYRNLGFLDQRLALDWVQENIAAFGGDPEKVTIFGESSGAASVDRLITSFPDDPPFRAAITESGQASTSYTNAVNGTVAWESLLTLLNCTSGTSALKCGRAAPALTIKSVIEHAALAFFPVTDDETQVADPKCARPERKLAKVPLLTGTNAQEGTLFTQGQTNISAALGSYFPNQPDLQAQVAQAYPLGSNGLNSPNDVVAQLMTEIVFQCPAAATANATAALNLPTYRYFLNVSFPNYELFPGAGVFHSAEVPLIFGTYPHQNATQQEKLLSLDMQTAWASFAKDPQQGPGWAKIGSAHNDVAVFGNGISSGAEVVPQETLDQRCGLFAGLYAGSNSSVL